MKSSKVDIVPPHDGWAVFGSTSDGIAATFMAFFIHGADAEEYARNHLVLDPTVVIAVLDDDGIVHACDDGITTHDQLRHDAVTIVPPPLTPINGQPMPSNQQPDEPGEW